MKSFMLFFKVMIAAFSPNCASQSLIKCNDRQAYWAIPDNNIYYTIRLEGDIDLSSQPDILNVNERALQYILLEKEQYILKNGENNDESILIRYTEGEAAYLRNKYKSETLDIYSEMIKFHSGKTAVFWYFKLPEGKNKEVTAQLFADIIIGERILGLGTPLFAGEDPEAAKIFLLQTIDTTNKVKNPDTLCHN